MNLSASIHRPLSTKTHHILLLTFLLLIVLPNDHRYASALKWNNKDKNKQTSGGVSAQELQDIEDAAMGTITSSSPYGKEKDPVTCDEIMAKAMVNANEAKAKAVVMKESAMEMASMELKRADKLTEELAVAKEMADHADSELERLKKIWTKRIEENDAKNLEKLMSMQKEALDSQVRSRKVMEQQSIDMEKTLAEGRRKASDITRKNRAEAKAEAKEQVEHVKEEMEKLQQASNEKIQEVQKMATEERESMKELKKKALDDVRMANENAESAAAQAKERIKKLTSTNAALVEKIQSEAATMLAKVKEENKAALAKAKEENEVAIVEVQKKATEEREELTSKQKHLELTSSQSMQELRKGALDDIRLANENAESAAASAKERIKKLTSTNTALVEKIQSEAATMLAKVKEENEKKIEETTRDADERVRVIAAELASYKISSAMQIEQVRKEAEATVEAKEKEKNTQISETKSSAMKEIGSINERTQKAVKEARDEVTNVKAEAQLRILNTNDHAEKKQLEIKEKSSREILKTLKEKKTLQVTLEEQLQAKSSKIFHLENDLKKSRDELRHWKTLHDIRSYVNITHIMEDATACLKVGIDKTIVTVGHASSAAMTRLDPVLNQVTVHWNLNCQAVAEFWKPYGKKISDFYDAHLKKTVDAKISPVLASTGEKIALVYEKHVVPFVANLKGECKALMLKVKKESDNRFESTSKTLRRSALGWSRYLKKKDQDKLIPVFVFRGLQHVTHNSSWHLSVYLKIMFACVCFLCRYILLNLFWGILLVPLQIVGFILRPLIGGGAVKIDGMGKMMKEEGGDESDDNISYDSD